MAFGYIGLALLARTALLGRASRPGSRSCAASIVGFLQRLQPLTGAPPAQSRGQSTIGMPRSSARPRWSTFGIRTDVPAAIGSPVLQQLMFDLGERDSSRGCPASCRTGHPVGAWAPSSRMHQTQADPLPTSSGSQDRLHQNALVDAGASVSGSDRRRPLRPPRTIPARGSNPWPGDRQVHRVGSGWRTVFAGRCNTPVPPSSPSTPPRGPFGPSAAECAD